MNLQHLPMKLCDELFENLITPVRPLPPALIPDELRFDPFDLNVLQTMPKLRLSIEEYRNMCESYVLGYVDDVGPIRLKMSKWRDNKFKDIAFDWLLDLKEGIEEDTFDFMWEECVHDGTGYYWGKEYSWDIEELEGFIGKKWPELHSHFIEYRVAILKRYHFNQMLIHHSEPVNWLRANGKWFTYMRDGENPLLVIDDPKLATYLKLTFG